MPSSVVHIAFAFLLAVGLLGAYYDRRALLIVVAVMLVPEADTLMGWFMDGAHRTVLHNMVFAAIGTVVLYWDTHYREESWVREKWGDYGARVAWAAMFAHVFAHLLLDYAHLEGINFLWPLHDQFFRIEGEAYLSTAEGFVQTFVEIAEDPETGEQTVDVGGGGGREEEHVANPAQPDRDPDPDQPVDRRFPIAVQGWQLYLVVTGLFAVVAKKFQTPRYPEEKDA